MKKLLSIAIVILLGSIVYTQLASEKIYLAGTELTRAEYDVKKGELILKVKEGSITLTEFQEWKSIADVEIKKCGSIAIPNAKSETLVRDINSFLESGKC